VRMPRLARVVVPGIPHHVTQRGNRRMPTFVCDEDYVTYTGLMAEWCEERGVEVWAYCLMPNPCAEDGELIRSHERAGGPLDPPAFVEGSSGLKYSICPRSDRWQSTHVCYMTPIGFTGGDAG